MIKLTKEVNSVFKELEKNGYDVYAYGRCVRESMIGIKTLDWDLATSARIDNIKEIFKDAEIIDEKREIARFVYESENEQVIIDLSPYGTPIVDENIKFYDNITDQLEKEYFVLDAMADNPNRTFCDPFDARKDMKAKIVRCTSDPIEIFKKNPTKMFDAVELAAELGYDLENELYEAVKANVDLISDDSLSYVTRSLERIVVADHSGVGLNILAETGLLKVIVGPEIFDKMNSTERYDYIGLCEGIDKVKKVKDRRLGLFYICFSGKRAHAAIDRLDFSERTNFRLHDGIDNIIKINFLGSYIEFKHYLADVGTERYNYLNNLSKAQRIVYDFQDTKIQARVYYETEIKKTGEAVFPEDLVIDENDIMEAGYADTKEKAYELLKLVVDVVHIKPNRNDRQELLKEAKKMSKSKFAVATRRILWLK